MQDQENNKSLRTAFIRIFGENNTQNGIIMYKFDDILKNLEDWSKSSKFKYWAIKHENDTSDEDKRTHYHVVIKFHSPTLFSVIKNRFPYGHIVPARSIKDCVQYLVHFNDNSKRQYSQDDIFTNSRSDIPKLFSNSPRTKDIEDYLKSIDRGEIREYNQFQKIPIDIWVKYRTKIENAHCYYRERTYLDKNRKIQTDFIYGGTGTGKTTFVKDYCTKNKLSLCISSSSNDPFQDYKGEDVLLLDDLRDTAFEYADLLKILDCHTKSTSKSRYHNKFFLGKQIFITSSLALDFWYPLQESRARLQMYRRIPNYWIFTMDKIKHFVFSIDAFKYLEREEYLNPIKNKYATEEMNNIMQTMKLDYADQASEQVVQMRI